MLTEAELERVTSRYENAEKKCVELEKELHSMSHQLRILETSEEQNSNREETFEKQLRELSDQLKEVRNPFSISFHRFDFSSKRLAPLYYAHNFFFLFSSLNFVLIMLYLTFCRLNNVRSCRNVNY